MAESIERFITYQQMVKDAEAWAASDQFDDVAAVAGVPRSGCIVAGIIAAYRNLHVLTLEEIERGDIFPAPLRRGNKEFPEGKIAVIEDTVRAGRSIKSVKKRIGQIAKYSNPEIPQREIIYGSLYVRNYSLQHVDIFGHVIPRWSTFQWNWRHDKLMKYALLDMDGVLHPDNVSADSDARPLFIPTVPIRAIVTGRGEHLRDITEAWLDEWNIQYRKLFMAPSGGTERNEVGGPHGFKAMIYSRDTEARLFIESDIRQAKYICGETKRPVLCTHNWKLYKNDQSNTAISTAT